jgi:hypothetical protein
MRNRLMIALAVPAILVGVGHAQEAEEAAHAAGYSLGLLRGLLETDYIIASQYDATGTMLVDGRMVEVPRYRAQILWDAPGMRVDYDLGVGAQPQRKGEVFAGQFAWDEDKPGAGLTPDWGTATPAPDTYEERLIQMWITPQGAAKAAKAAADNVTLTMVNDKPVLTFALPAPLEETMMTLTLNGQTARPEMAQVQTQGGLLEATFSDYKDFDNSDVVYPTRVVHTLDGRTVLDLTLSDGWGYNPYVIFPLPESVSAGPPGRVGG